MESDSQTKAATDSFHSENTGQENGDTAASQKGVEGTAKEATGLEKKAGDSQSKQEQFAPGKPVSQILFSEAQGDEAFEEEGFDQQAKLTLNDLKAAVDEMDDNIDKTFGQAADSIWNFATTVTGKVSSAVKEGQPSLQNLRKNVSSRLAPLDNISRDISSHIGVFAPSQQSFATITGSMKSVAASVQKNAEAMEAAILAKANTTDISDGNIADRDLVDDDSELLMQQDPSMGLLPAGSAGRTGVDVKIDVNEEIARVGETISNSIVGQTVGGLWTGLWGNLAGGDEKEGSPSEENVPKNRFEQRVFELQANPDTYCEPAKDLDAFEAWSKSFVLDDNENSCIAVLDTHETIAELYEKVVPRIVDEDTFWMRYFFARHVLEQEEERRKRLLERAENAVVAEENDEDGWGDDDWDEDLPVNTESQTSIAAGNAAALANESSYEGEASAPAVKIENTPPVGNKELGDVPTVGTSPGCLKSDQEKQTEKQASGSTMKSSNASAQCTDASEKFSAAPRIGEEPVDDWGDDDWE